MRAPIYKTFLHKAIRGFQRVSRYSEVMLVYFTRVVILYEFKIDNPIKAHKNGLVQGNVGLVFSFAQGSPHTSPARSLTTMW